MKLRIKGKRRILRSFELCHFGTDSILRETKEVECGSHGLSDIALF
jgi:hypothetical protein